MLQALLELYLKKTNLTHNSKKLNNLPNSVKDLTVTGDSSSEEEEEAEGVIEVTVVQDRIGKMLPITGWTLPISILTRCKTQLPLEMKKIEKKVENPNMIEAIVESGQKREQWS